MNSRPFSQTATGSHQADSQIERSQSSVSISSLLRNPFTTRTKPSSISNLPSEYNKILPDTDSINKSPVELSAESEPTTTTTENTSKHQEQTLTQDQEIQEGSTSTDLTLEEYREELKKRSSTTLDSELQEPLPKLSEAIVSGGVLSRFGLWRSSVVPENTVNESDETTKTDIETEPVNEQQPQNIHPPQLESNISPLTATQSLIERPISPLSPENLQSQANSQIQQEQLLQERGWFSWIYPVQRLSTLFSTNPLQGVSNQVFGPNELSEVVNSMNVNDPSRHSSRANTLESSHSASTSLNLHSSNSNYLWWPWNWTNNNKASTLKQPDCPSLYSSESSEELAKDAAAAVKAQSSANSRTSSWAFWKKNDEPSGELSVCGTGTIHHPTKAKSLPKSQFELQEGTMTKIVERKDSVVLPSLTYNLRDLTMKTKMRLILSSVSPLPMFTPETHLYHNSKYNTKLAKPIKKKAVVIGIHGFFPIKMVKTLIGEPTGTSAKFASETTKALQNWGAEHDIELDIETIGLEGEGTIFERANMSLGLLDNWMDSISSADYLFVTSHSQGVAVAIHVVSRLVTAGLLDSVKKVGLINMSGIFLGPFTGLDSKLSIKSYSKTENDVLMELFDFQDPETSHSRELIRHLRILIKKNIKLTCIGSIDDQLIPLYSSLCAHISHPNIFRAVHIDNILSQPDFITNLLNLIVTAKNLNLNDHELLVELSNFLKGQVPTGGHCGIYNGEDVYKIGIKHTLETSNLITKQDIKVDEINVKKFNINPYHLPWCLRGFLQEVFHMAHFDSEELILKLFKDFSNWDPNSKQHKDLKYCVEVFGNSTIQDLCI